MILICVVAFISSIRANSDAEQTPRYLLVDAVGHNVWAKKSK